MADEISSQQDEYLDIAGKIADGATIDWPALASRLEPRLIEELRVIADLVKAQRDLPVTHDEPSARAATSTAIRPRPSEGTPWGPLIVYERIGQGAFGEVLRAWDPALDHEVALKRVTLPAGSGPTSTAVVREGQLLARVKHPNVVTVHGACRVGDQVGIWMEFLRGRTLQQVVQDEGPMSAQEATVIGDCLCRALAAVHAAGLVHRDVKASNVMREAGGRIVLLDFGTGIEDEARALAETVAGTPLYLAPEVLDGAAASPVSDIYSLGVLLFYLTTGEYPISGQSVSKIQAAHRTGRRRLLADVRPDLPSPFVRVVERATSPAAADRYQSMGAMLRDLTATVTAQVNTGFDWRSLVVPLAGASVGIWILGLLTSVAFNLTLGRSQGFADDTFLSYWIWGFRALVAPAFFTTVATVVIMVLAPPLRRLIDRRIPFQRIALSGWVHGLVAAEVMLVIFTWWQFQPLFVASGSSVASDSPALFFPFRPDWSPERTHLIQLMSAGIVISTRSWLSLYKRARTVADLGTGAVTAGIALLVTMVAFQVVPYRLAWHNQFERVLFDSARCYVIGASSADVLLYCPEAAPPRTRVVATDDRRIERLNIVENIFLP